MKIGMNMLLWTAHVREEHYGLFDQLKAIGYDGAEISIGMGTIAEHQQLSRLLQNVGLQTSCVCAADPEHNPASPDPAIRAAAVDWLKERLEIAHALGADVLCGPNHSAFAYFTREAPTEDEYRWSAEVLHAVGDVAKSAGVIIALETLNRFECYLCNTVEQTKKLVDLADHPNVQAMFDTHHANIEEKSITDAIETIRPMLAHVHISENDRGTPGKGNIAWDDVFAALAASGYDGWLTIESFSRRDVQFANAINVWREYSPVDEVTEQGFQFIRSMVDKHFR